MTLDENARPGDGERGDGTFPEEMQGEWYDEGSGRLWLPICERRVVIFNGDDILINRLEREDHDGHILVMNNWDGTSAMPRAGNWDQETLILFHLDPDGRLGTSGFWDYANHVRKSELTIPHP